ncbi:MAG: hypothetical protein DSY46_00470 [Hydrogenimonas sp.]|nr:MAG: hypothetical protein DSY46_00470 [Hydrogenimonas sp.]
MKRRALIIGNSGEPEEYLEGVKKDVQNYNKFLKSNMGGKWYENEIILSLDETKEQVLKKLEDIKKENNDFVFLLFSGHGSYSSWKECRKLYLYNDFIYENELINIANKQITILDTCAGVENDIPFEKTVIAMESLGERYKFHKDYRAMYQEAIIKCPNQQVILYSSSIDESSQDDSELGGYFAYNLLKVALNNNEEILNSRVAYLQAKKIVQEKTSNKQNPQCSCIKSKKILPFSLGE